MTWVLVLLAPVVMAGAPEWVEHPPTGCAVGMAANIASIALGRSIADMKARAQLGPSAEIRDHWRVGKVTFALACE